jgi:electron transfer flavoprotein alpha subunit
MGEILVLVEQRGGELRDITFEMLTLANRLGREHGLAVTALFLGHGASDLAQKLTSACDIVLVMEDPELANYNADPYLIALDEVIKDRMPFLTMVGHTSMGMDIVPALAARLSLPLVTDCAEVSIADEGRLEVLRQIYGGKINAKLTMKPSDRYLISLRTGSFDAEAEQGKSGSVETVPAPSWTNLRGRKFLRYLEAGLEDVDIGSADILVSIGRGIGKPENIPLAQEFADSIGATLACSRPVADEQWLPKSRQVGTSGKTVRPRLYIALGISGAYQHQVGMKNSDTIIAVNTDPKAPIFNIAHYGIVADMLEVMPQLTDKFAKR